MATIRIKMIQNYNDNIITFLICWVIGLKFMIMFLFLYCMKRIKSLERRHIRTIK